MEMSKEEIRTALVALTAQINPMMALHQKLTAAFNETPDPAAPPAEPPANVPTNDKKPT